MQEKKDKTKKKKKAQGKEIVKSSAGKGIAKKTAVKKEKIDPEARQRGDRSMTIVQHLDEFRSRLLVSLSVLLVLTVASFAFSDQMLAAITKPYMDTGNKLNIFNLAGGFLIRLKVSFILAILLSIPFLLYQIWGYIRPAITVKDRGFISVSLGSSIFLFYGGASLTFFFLIPYAIKIFLDFIGKDMVSTIGADDYLSFIMFFSMTMGLVFELPIIVLILTRIGILSPVFLIKKRKYAIVLIWIFAAIITPQPDILSQAMVGIPLMILYEISILASRFVVRRKRRRENLSG